MASLDNAKLIFYSSIVVNNPLLYQTYINFRFSSPSSNINSEIANQIISFDGKKLSEQRLILNDESQAISILKVMFQFLELAVSEKALLQFVVCVIEGIMEGMLIK